MSHYVMPSVMDSHSPKCGCGECSQGLRGLDLGPLVSGAASFVVNSLKLVGIDVVGMVSNIPYPDSETNAIRALAANKAGLNPEDLVNKYKAEVANQMQGALPGIVNKITKNPSPAAVQTAVNNSVNAAKGAAKNVVAAFASTFTPGDNFPSVGGGISTPLLVGGAALAGLALLMVLKKKRVM